MIVTERFKTSCARDSCATANVEHNKTKQI